MMTKKAKGLAAGIAAGVLSLALVIPAFAQDDGDAVDTADPRAAHQAEFAAALAAELDLDEDTVAAAVNTVREQMRAEHQAERREGAEERLAAAVEAGRITQEQADAMLEAHEAGEFGLGRGMRGQHAGRGPGAGMQGFGRFGGMDG